MPIIFSEEQYNLSDLTNLWEAIGIYLEDHFDFDNLSREIEEIIYNSENFETLAFTHLETELKKADKKLVIFIENINVFFRKLSADEKNTLKNILLSGLFQIIGSSTTLNDGTVDFSTTFYGFLEQIRLDGVTKQECETLLLKIGEQYGEEEQISHIINNHPNRIEALRRLTGGVPRTISYLFQIFLDNENGKAIKDLYILIDTLTILYKAELDQLSSQQQKVIDAIARKWDATTVKEIVKKTRLESKNVSSILATLERNQFIEKIQTTTKNNLYRIRERFMNIWYLMRFGRKHDRDNVIWLVRFFDAWCDETQLTNILSAHLDNIKRGQYDLNAAIDMGNTFLSCKNISETLKLELIKITNSILPTKLLGKVKLSSDQIMDRVRLLIDEQKIDEAIALLDEIGEKDENYYLLASSLYLMAGNYQKSLDAAKTVLEMDTNNSAAALSLGIIYEDYLNDISSAETYYRMSISQQPSHPYAANRLGDLVYYEYDDIDQSEKHHRKAIAKNFKRSLLSLGQIFYHEKKYDKAEALLAEAVEANVPGANSALAKLYAKLKNNKIAKEYFQKAIKAQEPGSFVDFGLWYQRKSRPNYDKAISLFEDAIENGDNDGYEKLGRLYVDQKKIPQAISILKKGTKEESSESAHYLAHIFSHQRKYEESDAMFLKAAELGEPQAILCLVSGIFSNGRIDKRQFALQILEQNLEHFNDRQSVQFFYATILLWNDKLSDSLGILKASFEKFSEIVKASDEKEHHNISNRTLSQLFNYMLLLIAKKQYHVCLELFENHEAVDLKIILKPIYYVLMEILKDEYPNEYLMAGEELKDTIKEIKLELEELESII